MFNNGYFYQPTFQISELTGSGRLQDSTVKLFSF